MYIHTRPFCTPSKKGLAPKRHVHDKIGRFDRRMAPRWTDLRDLRRFISVTL